MSRSVAYSEECLYKISIHPIVHEPGPQRTDGASLDKYRPVISVAYLHTFYNTYSILSPLSLATFS